MDAEDTHFSIRGDFNNDGLPDVAIVGVYESKASERGNFIMILTQEPSGGWRKSFLEYGSEKPAFAALRMRDDILEYWTCMGCDAVSFLRWSGRLKEYIWIPSQAGRHLSETEIEQLEKGLRENTSDVEALNLLAWVYCMYPEYRGNSVLRNRAFTYAEKALALEAVVYFPEAYGAALYANGKLAEGDAWFDDLTTKLEDGFAPYYRETRETLRELYLPNLK